MSLEKIFIEYMTLDHKVESSQMDSSGAVLSNTKKEIMKQFILLPIDVHFYEQNEWKRF